MAGRKTYLCQDQEGRQWVVKAGDPAFELLGKLRHPTPTLPWFVLATGDLGGLLLDDYTERLDRLSRYFICDQDPAVGAAVLRVAALLSCLQQLTKEPM